MGWMLGYSQKAELNRALILVLFFSVAGQEPPFAEQENPIA
jgi:hypothetical protein